VLCKVVIRLHRVQDGGDHPPAEGARGRASLSPAHDARLAEFVEAWHHVAGLLPAVQADGTVVVQLRGHAPTHCSGLGGAGDDKLLPLTGTAAAGVVLEEEERPRSLADPGRAGRSAQDPPEGKPPSCPG